MKFVTRTSLSLAFVVQFLMDYVRLTGCHEACALTLNRFKMLFEILS